MRPDPATLVSVTANSCGRRRAIIGRVVPSVLVILGAVSCSTLYPADGGCTYRGQMHEYAVYSCPHPFPSKKVSDCRYVTREHADGHGPVLPCGWTEGTTDRATHVTKYWELYPEALQHEELHQLGRIADDE